MIDKLIERKQRETDILSGHHSEMSDKEFFKMAGIKVQYGN